MLSTQEIQCRESCPRIKNVCFAWLVPSVTTLMNDAYAGTFIGMARVLTRPSITLIYTLPYTVNAA